MHLPIEDAYKDGTGTGKQEKRRKGSGQSQKTLFHQDFPSFLSYPGPRFVIVAIRRAFLKRAEWAEKGLVGIELISIN